MKNPPENLAPLTIWSRNVKTTESESPRHVRGSAQIYVVRMAQFVLKIENMSHIIGVRGSQDLMFLFSDYAFGSWQLANIRFIDTKHWLLFQVWLPRPRLYEAGERRASCQGDLLIKCNRTSFFFTVNWNAFSSSALSQRNWSPEIKVLMNKFLDACLVPSYIFLRSKWLRTFSCVF